MIDPKQLIIAASLAKSELGTIAAVCSGSDSTLAGDPVQSDKPS
ncbi:hypothetical protein [Egbenema bharatensis]